MKLPSTKDVVIIHYGCSDFRESRSIIFWIGAIHYINNEKVYFFADGNEEYLIESFAKFLETNKTKTFLHWSMNSPKFGFIPIEKRYLKLKGSSIKIHPSNQMDLSEYLKNKYGVNYVSKKERLNKLAKLNDFTGFKNNIEVKNNVEASDRLELLFSIYQAESQGELKISRTSLFDVKMWNKPCFELFEYLMNNYYTDKKVQLVSIWFFLYDLKLSQKIYVLKCTQKTYKDFIKTHYEIEIKNFVRPTNWDLVETSLNDSFLNFKQI